VLWRQNRWCVAVAAVVAAAALGGCGLGLTVPDSAGSGGERTVSSSAGTTAVAGLAATTARTGGAPAVRHNEVPTPLGPAEIAPVSSSPRTALAHFADLYINWNAGDVKRQLISLSADCVGQARSAIALAAAQTGADPELRQAGIANRGMVEAVAPLPGAERHRFVVITRESTSATDSSAYDSLAPAWHLTVATVEERSGGWVISGWQPEN
jgi:hypothetical protein